MFYLYLILLPVFSGCVSFLKLNKNLRAFIASIICMVFFLLVDFLFKNYLLQLSLSPVKIRAFLEISFLLDNWSLSFLRLLSFLWPLCNIYCIYYTEDLKPNQAFSKEDFYAFYQFSIAACVGGILAGDLLTMFLFYEVLSLVTIPLININHSKEGAAALKYYIFHLVGCSAFFIFSALVVCLVDGGSLSFTESNNLSSASSLKTTIVMLGFVFGSAKFAIFPLHSWLPRAMVAPVPVSALLHAVAVVKLGAFFVFRALHDVIGFANIKLSSVSSLLGGWWLVYLACFSAIYGSFLALRQKELKKMLAYSTISQLSYIAIAIAMFSDQSAKIVFTQIAAHALSKITLFFCCGIILMHNKAITVQKIHGLAKMLPITCFCFCIAAFAMIGLPLTSGYIVKQQMLEASFGAGGGLFVQFCLLLSTILTAMYFLPIIYRMFFANSAKAISVKSFFKLQECNTMLLLVIIVFSVLNFLFFKNLLITIL